MRRRDAIAPARGSNGDERRWVSSNLAIETNPGQIQSAVDNVVTDGDAGYNENSLGERSHSAVVQTKASAATAMPFKPAIGATSLLKRWLLGRRAGAVSDKHLQA